MNDDAPNLEPTRPLVSEVSLADLSDKEWRYAWADPKLRWSIALQVYALRAQRGWSRRELGERAGISWMTIWRIEHRANDVSLRSLVRLAAAFDTAFVVRFCAWSEWLTFMRALEEGPWTPPETFGREDAKLRA